MLTEERRQHILGLLRRDGKVLSSKLSADLKVSEDTIRRDLREMADAGLLHRVHGGALPKSPTAYSYKTRQNQAPLAKQEIAKAAARLIRPGQVVILDSGTTAFLLAQNLPPDLKATLVTNSPPIATVLMQHPQIEVIVLGGHLNKDLQVVVGIETVKALQQFRADLCFLGVAGLHPETGITVYDYEEAHVKRMMMSCAAEVIALASSEKLGTVAPYVVNPVNALTHLVTEPATAAQLLAPYEEMGLGIVRK
ncbi:MAG: DeoR/GlpR transcriptional regulator [Leptolyngbya sp. SIO1E4]|nr:DeoR/GlpR transcriptional regulator [Leptolyngbya sp. SIO1E4]